MSKPAKFIIDVPVTLSVSVRGEGLKAERAKSIARKFADDLNPSEFYTKGYSDVLSALNPGITITSANLESSREDNCEVLEAEVGLCSNDGGRTRIGNTSEHGTDNDEEVFDCPVCGRHYEHEDDVEALRKEQSETGFCCDYCKEDSEVDSTGYFIEPD